MSGHPPFTLKKKALYWLAYKVEHDHCGYALALLWWQASIGPDGLNERLT